MRRIKSTPQDDRLIRDETAAPADRATAAECLASDGFGKEIHSVLDEWLDHSEFLLRDGALALLLGAWGHQKYVPQAIAMLHHDSNWSVRKSAANSLVDFTESFIEGEKYKEQIIKELITSLLEDQDMFVQKNSYQGLQRLITKKQLKEGKDDFDRNLDVDWKMLQPYLEKYKL